MTTPANKARPRAAERTLSTRRIWTIDEANAALPGLSLLISRQIARAADIERRFRSLEQRVGPLRVGGSEIVVPVGSSPAGGGQEARALESELNERIQEYEEGWRAVSAMDVSVKDPRIGLCDFYGRVEGKPVWLCWRYGEEAVAFYHHLDAGFSGRRPLTTAPIPRLLN
jgi:hypothetical protein